MTGDSFRQNKAAMKSLTLPSNSLVDNCYFSSLSTFAYDQNKYAYEYCRALAPTKGITAIASKCRLVTSFKKFSVSVIV